MLVVLLIVCVVLGMWADGAHRQRRVVEIVRSNGGSVEYDYHWWLPWRDAAYRNHRTPKAIDWVSHLLGIDFVAPVTSVSLELDKADLSDVELERILKLGGLSRLGLSKGHLHRNTLSRIGRLPRLRDLYLYETDLTDDGLKLACGVRLECLDISGTRVSDKGLAYLATLPDLYGLYLCETRITDAGLEQMTEQGRISQLSIGGTRVTDEGLSKLRMLPDLDWLVVDQSQLTESGVSHLRGLSKLSCLYVYGSGPSPAPLADLPSLRFLGCCRTGEVNIVANRLANVASVQLESASCDVLNDISNLPGLATLNIWQSPVSDEHAATLSEIKGLTSLTMCETGVSNRGAAHIRAALPACRVRVID